MNKYASHILLAIQLITMGLIVTSGPVIPNDPIMLLTQLFAIGLGLWAAYTLFKHKTFSALPELPKNAKLVTEGPFQFVRHPIYSGILLYSLVSILNYTTIPRLIILIVLTLVLLYKLHLEEDYLEHKFGSTYITYKLHTKRIIPYLY